MAITKLSDVTAADVNSYLGLSADVARDARVTAQLPLFTSQIMAYCRHDFESKARSNEKPIIDKETSDLFTRYRPIATLTSVVEDGVTLVENDDYVADYDTGLIRKWDGSLWSQEPKVIVLNYTGGVTLASAWEVLQVLYELIALALGLKTRTYINGEGVEGTVTLTALPPELLIILERHKQCRI
jgi:hypothetical protein